MRLIGIITAISAAILFWSHSALANNCGYHEAEIQRYTDLKRGGGNATRQGNWSRQRNYHKRELAKCNPVVREGNVSTASGQGNQRNYSDNRPEREITASNPALRKLQETCNFWIREHNRSATRDTLSQRNAACKAADQGHRDITTANPQYVEHIRSFKDCVKPGNVVDNEVSACMQGRLIPYWIVPVN